MGTAGVRFGYEPIYGELQKIETDNSVDKPTFSINYTRRDALGRITQVVETRLYPLVSRENEVDAFETITTDYGYDSRGRLETLNTQKVTNDRIEPASETVYSYDKNGNRTQVVTVVDNVTTTQIARYAADDRLLCMSDGATLTRFEYTGNGSLETKVVMTTEDSCDTIPAPHCGGNCATTTYDYDSMGNLLGVVLPNGKTITYEVDAPLCQHP